MISCVVLVIHPFPFLLRLTSRTHHRCSGPHSQDTPSENVTLNTRRSFCGYTPLTAYTFPSLPNISSPICNRHFEPVQWGTASTVQAEEDVAFQIPEMPELDGDHGLKIQPYPYQLQGIARGLQLKRFINGDDMGLGKQQPVSSYVATPNSFRRIGELQIGDEIFGRDGNVYAVSGVQTSPLNIVLFLYFAV